MDFESRTHHSIPTTRVVNGERVDWDVETLSRNDVAKSIKLQIIVLLTFYFPDELIEFWR
jgi:hypothetical protein